MSEKAHTQCEKCKSSDDFRWVPHPNEDGWVCSCGQAPGEPPGFCPQLDRDDTAGKINDLLMHLSGELGGPAFISISNGSHGDLLVHDVSKGCESEQRFDQYFILCHLIGHETARHSDFWKRIADGVVSGADPRDRCACGQLATTWSSERAAECRSCSMEMPCRD